MKWKTSQTSQTNQAKGNKDYTHTHELATEIVTHFQSNKDNSIRPFNCQTKENNKDFIVISIVIKKKKMSITKPIQLELHAPL